MNESLLGLNNASFLITHWGSAVLLAFVYLGITFLLQKKVHDLIRINGELSAI
jgi:hypothetical protein